MRREGARDCRVGVRRREGARDPRATTGLRQHPCRRGRREEEKAGWRRIRVAQRWRARGVREIRTSTTVRGEGIRVRSTSVGGRSTEGWGLGIKVRSCTLYMVGKLAGLYRACGQKPGCAVPPAGPGLHNTGPGRGWAGPKNRASDRATGLWLHAQL